MKVLFSLVMFISFISVFGQDKVYLDGNYKKTNSKELAKFYRVISPDPKNDKLVMVQDFLINGKIKKERKYSNYYGKKKVLGKNTVWYENGKIHLEGNYKKGKKEGNFISYWENGQLKRKDIYKKGVLKEGNCWDSSGADVPYYDFEIHPEFPGGKNALILYLKENIDYNRIPVSSKGQKVIIRFFIDSDGSIVDVSVFKGIDTMTDLEAQRVIKEMPKWKPAMQDGKNVKVRRSLPLIF